MSSTPSSPTESSTQPSSTVGLIIIAVLTLAVAAWLSARRPVSGADAARPAASGEGGPSNFDLDAWAHADDDLLGYVEIPAGPFRMGSDPGRDPQAYENERWSGTSYQGTVEVSVFYASRHEVTIGQFRAYVAASRARVDPRAVEGPSDHPVAFVSWPDALAYCRWLDAALRSSSEVPDRLRELLDAGFRVTLPTEAEWEKAARGADGRIFPWGDELEPGRANHRASALLPVGSLPCPGCAHGLSHMSGNVWELTRSPFRSYPYADGLDDLDLAEDALWVMRGGSYQDPAQNIRAAVRGGTDPGARRAFIGFRTVLSKSSE